jgi:CheY-like chemotaxis protein
MAFQQAGAQVTLADSARAALAALEASAPDVLVSDIGMPDGTGYELLERVRAAENGSRLPAVARTPARRIATAPSGPASSSTSRSRSIPPRSCTPSSSSADAARTPDRSGCRYSTRTRKGRPVMAGPE